MKIIIVTHQFSRNDGQGRVNYELARHAALSGHCVHLIAASVEADLLGYPGVSWSEATHGVFPVALLRNLWFAISSAIALRRIRSGSDLVIVNGAITFGSSDINAVHFVHGGWRASPYYESGHGLRGLYQRVYGKLNAWLEKLAFASSRVVIAVSRRVADELQVIGVPADKIRVVANGVDVGQFAPGPVSRTVLGLPQNSVIALFAGDITTERKNLETVLQALVHVPDLTLAVVGSTAASRFPHRARELGLEARVLFLGFRRDVADLMRASDLFVFPSRYEACSLVLLEALASGLPIITTPTSGGEELIPDDASIKIAAPNEVHLLSQSLELLTNSPHLRQQMGASARRHALVLTWENTAQGYLDICRSLADMRNAEGAL